MKILLTGGSGFIGRNILPLLRTRYVVDAPTRAQMDVHNQQSVDAWLAHSPADVLIHCAIVTPFKPVDAGKGVLSSLLQSFMLLMRHPFKKMIYIGSGAEYDKSHPIAGVSEESIGQRLPADEYGLGRYVLNRLARTAEHIYNLRVFGCYGPHETERRFIRHAIDCCLRGEPITIRQDCKFSYVYVEDLARLMVQIIENGAPHRDYNVCMDQAYYLTEIAEQVKKSVGCTVPILTRTPGLNSEYTGSNARLKHDFPQFRFTSLEEGILRQLSWQQNA